MTEPTDEAPNLDAPTDVSVGPDEVRQEQQAGSGADAGHEQTIDTPDDLGGTEGEGGAG